MVTKIVVGEILTAEQHPNADRLRVCTVDVPSRQAPCSTSSAARPMPAWASHPSAPWSAPSCPRRRWQALLIKTGKLRGGVVRHAVLGP